MSDSFPDLMLVRANELHRSGMDSSLAHGVAWLEERIRQWPAAYGDDLRIIIFGDFSPPEFELNYPSLGITVYPKKVENSIVRGAMTVLEAAVTVSERSVDAVVDAARRINLLLGAYTLHEWGNAGCGWWSWVTHNSGGGIVTKLTASDIERSAQAVFDLAPPVRKRVEAAMFWIRDPRGLLLESYRSDVLRTYASYWNAFECLVEAVAVIKPPGNVPKSEKQALIDDFLQSRNGRLSAADIQECYQSIVNPGFVGKASHALSVCFGEQAAEYIQECFRASPSEDRLYDIRNAINHGDIDAENPNELLRVEAKLSRLWMIVWRMFGRLIPFPAPTESNSDK